MPAARFETFITDAKLNNADQVMLNVFGNNERYDNDFRGWLYDAGRYQLLGSPYQAADLNERGEVVGVLSSLEVEPPPQDILLQRGDRG